MFNGISMISFDFQPKAARQRLPQGFTLVELMTTLAILAIISIGVFIQFQNLSPTQSLENGLDIFRSAFVDMRTAVTANQKCCDDTIPVGYGLSMTLDGSPDRTIILFADKNSDYLYTSSDFLISTITLPDRVNITECSTPTTSVTSGTCTLMLTMGSDGELYYNAAAATETMTFELTENSGDTASLNVYPEGFVIE